jgi:hypothetical protein
VNAVPTTVEVRWKPAVVVVERDSVRVVPGG